jgi:hypothetical protein
MNGITRDREFITRKYDEMWGAIHQHVCSKADLPGARLPELLRGTWEFSHALAAQYMQENWPQKFYLAGKTFGLSALAQEFIWRDIITDILLKSTGAEVDVIAELGAGWSANIFNLWIRGGPRGTRYYGCEHVEAGRSAAKLLAESDPELAFQAPVFDWDDPNFDFLPRSSGGMLVFSCHSIEQIPNLDVATFEKLIAITQNYPTLVGVHIEPVGWQYPELSNDQLLTKKLKEYAYEKNYNTNFRAVMDDLVAQNQIEVQRVVVDCFGAPRNPGTVVIWRRL